MIRTVKFSSMLAIVLLFTGCTTEVVLSVPDMMCEESCAVKVNEVLSKQPGVARVNVDFPNRTATLAVKPSEFDLDAAIAALVDYGFEESRLKTGDSPVLTSVAPTPPAADAVMPETPAVEINL
jgi:copper chaperone CopZ